MKKIYFIILFFSLFFLCGCGGLSSRLNIKTFDESNYNYYVAYVNSEIGVFNSFTKKNDSFCLIKYYEESDKWLYHMGKIEDNEYFLSEHENDEPIVYNKAEEIEYNSFLDGLFESIELDKYFSLSAKDFYKTDSYIINGHRRREYQLKENYIDYYDKLFNYRDQKLTSVHLQINVYQDEKNREVTDIKLYFALEKGYQYEKFRFLVYE